MQNVKYMQNIVIAIDAISSFFVGATVVMLYWQIRFNQKWNRTKTSEEVLSNLVQGDFVSKIDSLENEFGWNPLSDNLDYSDALQRVGEKDKARFNSLVRNIFRTLEVICIKIHHGVIDEEICKDYLISILINFYSKSKSFIDSERKIRKESRVFEFVEYYAQEWQNELRKSKQSKKRVR